MALLANQSLKGGGERVEIKFEFLRLKSFAIPEIIGNNYKSNGQKSSNQPLIFK